MWNDNEVSIDVGDTLTISGSVTIDSGTVDVSAIKGSLTIDSGSIDVTSIAAGTNSIGFATVEVNAGTLTAVTDITNPVETKGNVTINSGVITTVGAVTDITNPIVFKGNVTLDDGSVINTVNAVTAVTDITNPIALKGNVTIDSIQGYSSALAAAATLDWAVKGSAGYLHAIVVGDAVASAIIEVSDHASDGDGNVKVYLAGDTLGPALYPINMTMASGIATDITNQTHVTFFWR